MTESVTPLKPQQATVLRMIKEAIDKGEPCPTNDRLSTVLGTYISQPVRVIDALVALGLITVKRTRRARVVTLVATGQSTARPAYDGAWRRDQLAELMAEGATLAQAATAMGISQVMAARHWTAIRRQLGWQAQ